MKFQLIKHKAGNKFKMKSKNLEGRERVCFKIFIVFIAVSLIAILQSNYVLGNFVCGKVNDSEDNFSASWFNVRVFYPENREKFATCEISPAGNKYCCDSEAIPGKKWKIGDEVGAEVFDNISGYVAGPVFKITTGEGYDVMPEMKLEKVIKIFSPKEKLIFSNESKFLLNASFLFPYNFIEIEREKEGNLSKEVLCENCSRFSGILEGNFGMNFIKVFARESEGGRIFLESKSFAIVRNYDFERLANCEKCRKVRKRWLVKGGSVINIDLNLNISDYIENLELKEYVPVDWEILDAGGGNIKEYSDSHNVIIWNVSGREIKKSYKIKAPIIRFFPQKYHFRTELENKEINEEEFRVYRWFWFFPFKHEIKEFTKKNRKFYFRVSPSKPIVLNLKGGISKIAIFPKKKIDKTEFGLEKCPENKNIKKIEGDVLECYTFNTNLGQADIEKVYVKINKIVFNKHKNLSLICWNSENYEKRELEVGRGWNGEYFNGCEAVLLVNNQNDFLKDIGQFFKSIFLILTF